MLQVCDPAWPRPSRGWVKKQGRERIVFDVAERDIARTARAVQRIEGRDAVRVVTKLIARFQQAGDVAGAELWERVLAALPASAAVRSARDVDRIESRRALMTTVV